MPELRIMTFNAENMLVRFNFRRWERERLATLLDIESDIDRANLIRTHWNVINDENRVFTALTIGEADADVVCLQEVENMHSLEAFHDRYLRRITGLDYKYKVLIEGNDPRGIDVAVLSRYKIESISTNRERTAIINYPDGPKEERVFRRDCLKVLVKKHNKLIPVFVCHFKSMSGGRPETKPIRDAESNMVRGIIEEEFQNPEEKDWIVLGDLNDYTETDGVPDNDHGLTALFGNDFSIDLVKRIPDIKGRWTHYYPSENSYHQLDYILCSPSLAEKNENSIPSIIRNGQPFRAKRYEGTRWPRIGFERPKASDHCPVAWTFNF